MGFGPTKKRDRIFLVIGIIFISMVLLSIPLGIIISIKNKKFMREKWMPLMNDQNNELVQAFLKHGRCMWNSDKLIMMDEMNFNKYTDFFFKKKEPIVIYLDFQSFNDKQKEEHDYFEHHFDIAKIKKVNVDNYLDSDSSASSIINTTLMNIVTKMKDHYEKYKEIENLTWTMTAHNEMLLIKLTEWDSIKEWIKVHDFVYCRIIDYGEITARRFGAYLLHMIADS